ALLHQAGYKLFALGKPASVGLEMLAEGAATADLLATSLATGIVWTGTASSQGPIGPGGRSTMTVDLPEGIDPMAAYLSAASMLVNTNDAITAVRSLSLHGLNIGSSISMDINSYDTGTEANDEVGAHIPGPAGGGIGFDANRNDIINAVLPHPGVITADDGLDGSALYDIHRWKNPVARLLVRRVQ
ncbi:MAG: spondin domain-containing protein, partial [Burkholderiaceae bacterium]